jgi:hypothetical protein
VPTDAIYTTLRQMNYALDELEQTLARAEALHFEQIKKLQAEHEAALVAVRVQAQEQVQVQPQKTEPQPVADASSPPSAKTKSGQSQSDLFANWTSGGNSPANDPKALILAKKLDSTIDKVQRLLAQAGA